MAKGGKGRKGGGGGGGKTRKYSRDSNGRFASTGTGATARGGRLLTAKGNKRKTQTITATGQKGVLAKPKGLKPESTNKLKTGIFISKRRAVNAQLANKPDQAVVNIPGRFTGRAGKSFDASITRAVATVKASKDAKFKTKAEVKADQAKAKAAKEAKPKRIRSAESLRVSRAKQIEKRRSITTNPAGVRASAAAKMAANATRTQQRAAAFYKAGGKPAAAAKPAAPKAAKAASKPVKKSRTPDAAKVSRIAARFQAQGAAPQNPSKVKRLNTIETRQRAMAFLAKPNSKGADAAGSVAQNIAKRKTYSTTTPNRNKPMARASLGQKTIREQNRKTTQGLATTRAQDTKKATQRVASPEPTTPRAKAASAQRIENSSSARKSANAAKAAANEVKYFRKDSDSQAYKNALAKRDRTLALRAPGTNKIAFRSRRMAIAAQRQRINNAVERTNIRLDRKRGEGVKRSSTGMTQLGLMGQGKKLFRVRKITGIKRPSGSKLARRLMR